jgi:putative SOS response-associated peptidase YedK
MCGRYVSSTPPDQIASYFGADAVGETVVVEPDRYTNYNVAPSTEVFVVVERDGHRVLDRFHWGLLPIWAKEVKVGNRMINARAESVREKNAFKHAFRKRRCLIPADGFYEWTALEGQKRKQPWYIHRTDGDPLAFAGLWELWRGPDRSGEIVVASCSIITGEPNEKMATIHNRMPVILPPDNWARWLDPEMQDMDAMAELLVPAPSELISIHAVSTEVNNVRNKGAELIDPVESPPGAGPDA